VHVGAFRQRIRDGMRMRDHRIERGEQRGGAAATHGHGFDHRHAQFALQFAATSMSMPRFFAASAMFSATSMGLPSARTSSTKRRCRRRLVASTTQTSRSGAASPG
jgi:hypothetical protein